MTTNSNSVCQFSAVHFHSEFTARFSQAEKGNWVKVTSDDGFAFLIKRDVANGSETLKNMLSEEASCVAAADEHYPLLLRHQ